MAVKLSRYIFRKIRGRIIPIRVGAKSAPKGISKLKPVSMQALRKRQSVTNRHIRDKIKNFTKDSVVKKKVFHGTDARFNKFDHSFIGKNSTALGRGFYFTNVKKEASGYGKVGEYFLNIKKPMKIGDTKIKRSHLRSIMRTSPDALSNFGDVHWEGKKKIVNKALDIYEGLDDVEKLNALGGDNYFGNFKALFKRVRNTLGIDAVTQTYPKRDIMTKHYVALNADQIMKAPRMNRDYSKLQKLLKKKPKQPKLKPTRAMKANKLLDKMQTRERKLLKNIRSSDDIQEKKSLFSKLSRSQRIGKNIFKITIGK